MARKKRPFEDEIKQQQEQERKRRPNLRKEPEKKEPLHAPEPQAQGADLEREKEIGRQLGRQLAGMMDQQQAHAQGPQAQQERPPEFEQPKPEVDPLPGQQHPGGSAVVSLKGTIMTPERIHQATAELQRYREGKASLDKRIVENQEWYRMRHWESMRRSKNPNDPEPSSAWLLNSLANKHADAMDSYPEPVILAREEGDKEDAEIISKVLPVALEQNSFEATYSEMWWRKLKTGTGAYGVFWNSSKLNGLGDIDVKAVDLLNLYWQPGIRDLQRSRNLFCVELIDNDILEAEYPQLKGKLGGVGQEVRQYVHDENIDTSHKSVVVDWYYKTGGKLHFCKFCNGEALYSSEEQPEYAERGFYDHGLYPFVFDVLFPDEDSPAGFGYLDVCKDVQTRIDKLNQVIYKNAMMASRPRYFIKGDGSINEEEFADWEKDFVHVVAGGAPQDNVMPIEVPNVSGNVLTVLQNAIDELKETSGNRDFSQGGTAAGVTAASAIAALQEAGSKLSRDMIKASYRSFVKVCELCLELIRQFYTEPRFFRIVGEMGRDEYVEFDNKGMMPQVQGDDFGIDLGVRVPIYDIQVKAQQQSPFKTVSQNELAKEFYGAGFFNPQMADQALACLEMMTFEGKEGVVQRIARNGTMFDQLQQLMQLVPTAMQMATILDAQNGTNIAEGMAQQFDIPPMQVPQQAPQEGAEAPAQGDETPASKDPMVQGARSARQHAAPESAVRKAVEKR